MRLCLRLKEPNFNKGRSTVDFMPLHLPQSFDLVTIQSATGQYCITTYVTVDQYINLDMTKKRRNHTFLSVSKMEISHPCSMGLLQLLEHLVRGHRATAMTS